MSTFSTSSRQKRLKTLSFFTLLTSKCASRHNGVHFFDIWTSKSGPNMVCFVHFDLEMCFAPQRRALFRHRNFQKWSDHGVHFDFKMCFAPQRRALFRHRNFQKWSDHGVFCTFWCFAPQRRALFRHLNFQKWSAPLVFCPFWLGNVLRATTACTFSCLIWPAGSASAALASLLFDPPEPQIIGKTQWIATFLSFRASTSSFFWSFLFWLFSPLLFNCPYCRKFHF